MQGNRTLSLGVARWIVIALYFSGVVIYPVIGAAVTIRPAASAQALRLLGPLLLAAGVVDYIASLILERTLLSRARPATGGQTAAVTAVIVSAFGESLAIFGLVLSLLGLPNWGLALYALCFVHGVHLGLRWPHYERAAESRR
jgi:hypothetical protein